MNEIIQQEMDDILNYPLPESPEKAVDDLIYVLENLIEGNILPPEKGFPIFLEILNLDDKEKTKKRFERIKEKIISAMLVQS